MSALDGWKQALDGWDGWGQALDGWDGWPSGPGNAAGGLVAALSRSREGVLGTIPAVDGPRSLLSGKVGWPSGTHVPGEMVYWSAAIRQRILLTELLPQFAFSSTSGEVELASQTGALVCKLVRPKVEVFEEQVAAVETYVLLRNERTPEILAQRMYTPSFFAAILPLDPRRTPYTLELMEVLVLVASCLVQRFKHELNCPRPRLYSPLIQPVLPDPPYSTYPSGHCTESFLLAEVLAALITPSKPTGAQEAWLGSAWLQLRRLAERIATNRVVAGIHFPVDNVAGHALGKSLAEYLRHLADPESMKGWQARTVVDPSKALLDSEFDPFQREGSLTQSPDADYNNAESADKESTQVNLSLWPWLWQQARAEWVTTA